MYVVLYVILFPVSHPILKLLLQLEKHARRMKLFQYQSLFYEITKLEVTNKTFYFTGLQSPIMASQTATLGSWDDL